MNCLRCGRGIALGQAFCKDCLTDMEQHPVKPGTTVQLPTQPPEAKLPAPVRKAKKPEEQLARFRKHIVVLSGVIVLLAAGLTVTLVLLLSQLGADPELPLPGQNYNTMVPVTYTEPTTTQPAFTEPESTDVSRETWMPSEPEIPDVSRETLTPNP